MPNAKTLVVAAVLLTKRSDIRDAVRAALKSQGVKADSIQSVTEDKELFDIIAPIDFAMLILDWEYSSHKILNILAQNRKQSRLEAFPVFLIAAHEDPNIIALAHEYFISYFAVGEVTMDTIREQIKGLVRDFQNLSPIRKMLLAVEAAKESGDVQKATDMLNQLFIKHPDNQRIGLEYVECLIYAGDWTKSEQILKKMINQEDCYARVKHLYARCRLKQGDHEGAIASLKGAQLISPYNVERLLEIGNLFLNLDKPEEAEDAFSSILDFAPDAKEAKVGLSTSKLLIGEVNEALSLLKEFASPRELSAVFNTAAILAIRQKRYDSGFELYQKASQILAKKPKLLSRILYNTGIGYVKSGKLELGLQQFEKASEADPDFADASHNIKILKTAVQNQARLGNQQTMELLDGLEERFTTSMPMVDVGDSSEEEVSFDDVLANIGKIS